MKILCPIDFTPASLNGLQYAVMLSNTLDAELHVINVYNFGDLSSSASFMEKEIKEKMKEKMAKVLTGIAPLLQPDNLPVTKIFFGSPELKILEYVNDIAIDFLVISTEGKKNLENFIFGSTSKTVVEHLNIPVIVVPKSISNHSIKKMVLAIDSDEILNDSFLETPKQLAKAFDTKIDVIHVVKENDNPLPFDPFVMEYLKDTLGEVYVEEGDNILQTLNNFTEEKNYDLVIMLKQSHNFLHRLFFESKAIKEIGIAKTPLLITKYDA